MAAGGARVIDLEEFRRRRSSARPEHTPFPAAWIPTPMCFWYPVWYWVLVAGG